MSALRLSLLLVFFISTQVDPSAGFLTKEGDEKYYRATSPSITHARECKNDIRNNHPTMTPGKWFEDQTFLKVRKIVMFSSWNKSLTNLY